MSILSLSIKNSLYAMKMSIAALVVIFVHSALASSDEHHDNTFMAHQVHLSGYAGDNTANRNALLSKYKACMDRNAISQKKTSLLPQDGVPEIPQSIEDDIYYSANRTLTVKQGKTYDIDFDTCELVTHLHHVNELRSVAGICSIDMIKKEARGQCDRPAQESVSASGMVPATIKKTPTFDLDKVPPELQATLLAQMERLKTLPKTSHGIGLPVTGESKIIANYECEIYRNSQLDIEVCVAHPKGSFVIPAAGLNATVPGLLLKTKSKALTMQANKVNMDIAVPQDIFFVPADIKILSR